MVRTARRTRKILQIVQKTPVATQAELVRALRGAGVDVTQATVSRDIKRLGLVKVPVNGTRYRYAGTSPCVLSTNSDPTAGLAGMQPCSNE